MRYLLFFAFVSCGEENPFAKDDDGDGYVKNIDCDDTNATVYPNAKELCDSIDNDCDNFIDEDATSSGLYLDEDEDGYGTGEIQFNCPSGSLSTYNGDCNDSNPDINPEAIEIIGNGIDENCTSYDQLYTTNDWITIETSNRVVNVNSYGDQRQASLDYNFEIQRFEVSEEDYQSRMFYNPSLTECDSYTLLDAEGNLIESTCPVDNVSFSEAAYYANLLSAEEGLESCYVCSGSFQNVDCSVPYYMNYFECEGYRLPTMLELNMVYRSNTTFDYTYNSGTTENPQIEQSSISPSVSDDFGCSDYILNDNTHIGDHFWFCGNSLKKSPSGLKSSSAFPVYDILGNVGEWIQGDILESYDLSPIPSDNINFYTNDYSYYYDSVFSFGENIYKFGIENGDYRRVDYDGQVYRVKSNLTGFRLVRTLPDSGN